MDMLSKKPYHWPIVILAVLSLVVALILVLRYGGDNSGDSNKDLDSTEGRVQSINREKNSFIMLGEPNEQGEQKSIEVKISKKTKFSVSTGYFLSGGDARRVDESEVPKPNKADSQFSELKETDLVVVSFAGPISGENKITAVEVEIIQKKEWLNERELEEQQAFQRYTEELEKGRPNEKEEKNNEEKE